MDAEGGILDLLIAHVSRLLTRRHLRGLLATIPSVRRRNAATVRVLSGPCTAATPVLQRPRTHPVPSAILGSCGRVPAGVAGSGWFHGRRAVREGPAMKLFVHHDVSGKIHSVVAVDAPDGVSMMLVPRRGRLVAEVEGHAVKG
jgi:hypothetical protein